MTAKHCLNCNETVSGKFCPNCGQKTDTHRITLKKFLAHDILHGVWHFEKGILFTLKEAIIRPGQAALDYISGKRVRYYNVFYLSLLVIGLNLLLNHFYDRFNTELAVSFAKDDTPVVTNFFKENVKFILLSIIPVLGLSARLFFRRLKLNIAEHMIIAGFCLLGILQFAVLFSFVNFLNEFNTGRIVGILEVVLFFPVLLFPLWAYFNAVRKCYGLWGSLWRVLLFYILVLVLIQTILAVIILTLTNGQGNFYINV